MSYQPGQPARDAGARPSGTRRAPSERSGMAVPDQADANVQSSVAARTMNRGSPQPASSRGMTPPDESASIKYTRTGRVSKATKGQRVHYCEECGKTYTRAEHLRRHQQNHKPGAFPCDIAGCGRSFYREDLLVRHKARHDDPLDPPSRPQSRASHASDPSYDDHDETFSRPPASHLSSSATISGSPAPGDGDIDMESASSVDQRSTKIRRAGPTLHHQHRSALSFPANEGYDSVSTSAGWNSSGPFSPRYDSPSSNDNHYGSPSMPYYHQPQATRSMSSSQASYAGYGSYQQSPQRSGSIGPEMFGIRRWTLNALGLRNPSNSSSGSATSYVNSMMGWYNPAMTPHVTLPDSFQSLQMTTAADRDYSEQDDLGLPPPGRHDSTAEITVREPAYSNEERYLGSYWLWVHPLYPVIHRPSFSSYHASPLLKAAMLALGANALGDPMDKTNARILHERCLKVLKRRTLNDHHSFRLCDLQAVVLVEVYALFKSRRPPLRFSKAFEDVYNYLAHDQEALNPLPHNINAFGDPEGNSGRTTRATSILCKQRLVATCYILDSQNATLFGRQRTLCYIGAAMDLPFPLSLVSWDGQHRQRGWPERHDRVWQALDGGNMDDTAHHQPYDVFQSLLMIACLAEPSTHGDGFYPSDPNKDLAPVIGAMQQSAQIKVAYNTFMLCKHTPIRDILAVAGESWVMAEKLSQQSDYVAAQAEARDWASADGFLLGFDVPSHTGEEQQPAVQKAVRHALRLIDLHMNHPKTGLLFQEWSVYLAALVIWAQAYVSTGLNEAQRVRLSVPDPGPPILSSQEIEQTVNAVVSNANRAIPNQEEARRILLWVKIAIEKVDLPHNCGLTNGALDVLGKLVTRGTEYGWFGS